MTCDQPEPDELGFGLLAFGAVASVSVPVENASAGITLGDFLHGLAQRLLFAYVGSSLSVDARLRRSRLGRRIRKLNELAAAV